MGTEVEARVTERSGSPGLRTGRHELQGADDAAGLTAMPGDGRSSGEARKRGSLVACWTGTRKETFGGGSRAGSNATAQGSDAREDLARGDDAMGCAL